MRTACTKRRLAILCLIACLFAQGVALADAYRPNTSSYSSSQYARESIGIVTIHEVTKNGANIREFPDAETAMVGYVPMGTTYLCLSRASNGWCEILLPTGVTGYVSGKLVDFSAELNNMRTYSSPIGTVTVSRSSRRTYAAPTSDSDFMGSISPGNTYYCVDIVGDWYCIAVNHGEKGDWIVYVYRDGLQFTPIYPSDNG